MFEQMFENMRKATDNTLQVQQETFRRWVNVWPGGTADQAPGVERAQQFQKQWADTVSELLKKQRETFDAQLKAGLANMDEAFKLAEAKTPEELRTKTVEFWQKSVDSLRQAYEAQMKEIPYAMEKWAALFGRGPA